MKRLIPVLLLLAIGGAVVYYHPQWFHHPEAKDTLRLSGNIEAHESLVSFKVTGRVIALPVEEGMTLKRGDLLARLDSADYRQQVGVDDAVARSRSEQLSLALAGSRRQEIEAAKLAMADAQADLEQKKKDYARYQALYEKDEIPGQTRDLAATNVTRAQAAYERDQQIYNELVEGTRKEELDVDRANLQQAKQNVEMSRIRLAYTVLRAPFNGVVLERQAELGEVVLPGTPIVTLADVDHLWVRVYVPKPIWARFTGDRPPRSAPTLSPDERIPGASRSFLQKPSLLPKACRREKERVTLVYRIKVNVENPQNELKPGMPADVDIKLR